MKPDSASKLISGRQQKRRDRVTKNTPIEGSSVITIRALAAGPGEGVQQAISARQSGCIRKPHRLFIWR
jgi:hypothetical protein